LHKIVSFKQADSAPAGWPADSGGDLLPVPTPRTRLSAGFGGFASPGFTACRLRQGIRLRDLYRWQYLYHIFSHL